MAVAVADDSIGAAEDRALVRSTFIISPNVPMMAAPGDEFDVSVTVTNNQKGAGPAGKVKLTASVGPQLSILSEKALLLDIPEGQDKTVTFRVKATSTLGGAAITFTASNGGASSTLASFLSVRPAVPYRVTLNSGVLRKASVSIPVTRRMSPEFATRDVSLSYLPLGIAKGLKFYLDKYPYGCSEQLVSATFPYLYPSLVTDLNMTTGDADAAVRRTISILQARIRSDNTIGLWTYLSETDPFIDAYCVLFLTEARERGYYVPPVLMNSCISGLESIASGNIGSGLAARAFAIYVLTRNEMVTTGYIEQIKQELNKRPEDATGYAGLYLAGTYAILKQNDKAASLFGKINRNLKKEGTWQYCDTLHFLSTYLDIVARHFPQRLKDVSADQLLLMAAELEQENYTTLSANAALMAIESYLEAVPTAETGKYSVTETGSDKKKVELTASGDAIFQATFSPQATAVGIESRDPLNLFYQMTTAGFDLEPPKVETKQGIEIYREYSGASISKTDFSLGDVISVKVHFRTTDGGTVSNVAIVDMLPSGFEADISSIRMPQEERSWVPDYVDIREDRIVIFGTVTGDLSTFTYNVRAINTGTFTVPPLFAEAMYDKKIWAYKPQNPISITSR
jgi:uncharacterized protein YfaS (alpha-2-macroglobulin family)